MPRTSANLTNKGFSPEEQEMIREARKRKSENALAVYVDLKYRAWLERRGLSDETLRKQY